MSNITIGSLNSSYAANMPNAVAEQDNKNNQVVQQIKALKEQEIINAKNSYAQNMAGYGANAAALSAMGLSGSGYSDYLNAKAYAAYRDDVQAANAKEQSSLIKYHEGLNNKYFEILSELEQGGGGSVDYITQLSNQLGLSPEQTKTLTDKARYNEAVLGLESKSFGSATDVESYINPYLENISDSIAKEKIKEIAVSAIKARNFDPKNITADWIKDALTSSQINTLAADDYDSLKNGDDITVKIGDNSYKVESDGETKNSEILDYARNNNLDGKIFSYGDNDNLYIYKNNKAYKITAKSMFHESDYNAVKNYFTGESKTESTQQNSKKKLTSNNPRSKNYKK